MHGTEFKIVDPETNNVLPPGSKGIIKVRGPQVMKGYYKVLLHYLIAYLIIILLRSCENKDDRNTEAIKIKLGSSE